MKIERRHNPETFYYLPLFKYTIDSRYDAHVSLILEPERETFT